MVVVVKKKEEGCRKKSFVVALPLKVEDLRPK
jgi:hypothetical protein